MACVPREPIEDVCRVPSHLLHPLPGGLVVDPRDRHALTREALLDAMKRRHSYGATDNIVLDYRLQTGGRE